MSKIYNKAKLVEVFTKNTGISASGIEPEKCPSSSYLTAVSTSSDNCWSCVIEGYTDGYSNSGGKSYTDDALPQGEHVKQLAINELEITGATLDSTGEFILSYTLSLPSYSSTTGKTTIDIPIEITRIYGHNESYEYIEEGDVLEISSPTAFPLRSISSSDSTQSTTFSDGMSGLFTSSSGEEFRDIGLLISLTSPTEIINCSSDVSSPKNVTGDYQKIRISNQNVLVVLNNPDFSGTSGGGGGGTITPKDVDVVLNITFASLGGVEDYEEYEAVEYPYLNYRYSSLNGDRTVTVQADKNKDIIIRVWMKGYDSSYAGNATMTCEISGFNGTTQSATATNTELTSYTFTLPWTGYSSSNNRINISFTN